MWTIIFDLILIVLVFHICKKAYHYERVSRFHHFIIPVYSLILFLITMKWNPSDLRILACLLPAAILIGLFQTTGIEVKRRRDPKTDKKHYYIKENTPFVIGWVVMLVIGIAMGEIFGHEGFMSLFSDKIFEDIIEEINPLSIFVTSHPWYIWLLSGVSSLVFINVAWYKIRRKEEQGLLEEELLEDRKAREKR